MRNLSQHPVITGIIATFIGTVLAALFIRGFIDNQTSINKKLSEKKPLPQTYLSSETTPKSNSK